MAEEVESGKFMCEKQIRKKGNVKFSSMMDLAESGAVR